MEALDEAALHGPTGSPYCGLCGLLWTEHERDDVIGPMGIRAWVCRLPEAKFNDLLKFMENENNWSTE